MASAPSPLPPGGAGNRTSSGAHAALYIRRLIFDGHLRPGARVPQDDIAQTLGVSRIPIREALIALEREGWVTIELHRGAFINALDADAVRDHYGLFGLVYGFAARRALARPDAAALVDAMGEVVKAMAMAKAPETFGKATLPFHQAVLDAARSSRIKVVVRAMSAMVPGDFFTLVPAAVPIERKGLAAIARAAAAGDADRVADEYGRMMELVGEKVIALFETRGLFEQPGEGGR